MQQFAPKLIASLDRAINFCNSSLKFGRAEEAEPRRELMRLKPLVEEVGDGLGLPREGKIRWIVDMDDSLRVDADHEHLFRILSNLVRNAVQAIEQQGEAIPGEIRVQAWRDGRKVFIEVADNGPGVPRRRPRQPLPRLPGLDAQGRHGPRARHRRRARRACTGASSSCSTPSPARRSCIELPDRVVR